MECRHFQTIIAPEEERIRIEGLRGLGVTDDDDDVYLDELQTRGVKKSILYM